MWVRILFLLILSNVFFSALNSLCNISPSAFLSHLAIFPLFYKSNELNEDDNVGTTYESSFLYSSSVNSPSPSWNSDLNGDSVFQQELEKIKGRREEEKVSPTIIVSQRSHANHSIGIGKKKESAKPSSYLPPQQPSNDAIYFFPWEDKQPINYNHVCSSLLSNIRSFQGPPIVCVGKYGGIGHVAVSMYHALLYSLLLQRPLYFQLKPLFWKHTNSCLKSLIYTGNVSELIPCGKSNNCFRNKKTVTSLINKPVAIYDSRLHWSVLFTEKNLCSLQSLFDDTVRLRSWKVVKRLFFRITLNPSPQLIPIILKKRKKLGKYEGLVGVHIRCGGQLADSKEGIAWMDTRGLDRVQFTIRKALYQMSLPRKDITMYLATDSSIAEKTLRRTMAVKIVTYNQVTRGHTTSSSVDSVYQSAIIDMFLVSQASVVIYSHTSGFSEAILSMANAKRQYILPFDKH